MKVIINLKVIDAENTSLDDLFLIRAQLAQLKLNYETSKLGEAPEWIVEKFNEVGGEIDRRVMAILKKRLKTAEARKLALEPRSFHLEAATKEIEALRKLINGD